MKLTATLLTGLILCSVARAQSAPNVHASNTDRLLDVEAEAWLSPGPNCGGPCPPPVRQARSDSASGIGLYEMQISAGASNGFRTAGASATARQISQFEVVPWTALLEASGTSSYLSPGTGDSYAFSSSESLLRMSFDVADPATLHLQAMIQTNVDTSQTRLRLYSPNGATLLDHELDPHGDILERLDIDERFPLVIGTYTLEAIARVGAPGFEYNALSTVQITMTPEPIPEPSTAVLALAAIGAGAAIVFRRRSKLSQPVE
jgi:hypothetical protein